MTEPTLNNQALLATRSLSKSFGGLHAVRDVSIALRPGQLHAVIGPNGAGKSTLVNLLAGDLLPTSGEIELAGQRVERLPGHARVHLGIARSFQRTNIFPTSNVLENVRLAAQAAHAKASQVFRAAHRQTALIDIARAALKRAGLLGEEYYIAGTLSHGAQRQLEIAMALAAEPKVLLLDEPMAGMGPEESQRIAALLKELSHDHAILLIEHDMDFVFAVADILTVMVDGTVIASGTPAEIRANAHVQAAYLGGHA